jgi:hypothetical protein
MGWTAVTRSGVVTTDRNTGWLRAALGADAGRVAFGESSQWYRHPVRALAAVHPQYAGGESWRAAAADGRRAVVDRAHRGVRPGAGDPPRSEPRLVSGNDGALFASQIARWLVLDHRRAAGMTLGYATACAGG